MFDLTLLHEDLDEEEMEERQSYYAEFISDVEITKRGETNVFVRLSNLCREIVLTL